jgi:hypothetical protein
MSAKADLGRRVLGILKQGHLVSPSDATELRKWAVRPEDTTLTLKEIAHGILDQSERSVDDVPAADWRRVGAEFILADLEVAFTFLDVARTSWIAQTCTRNQKNARSAYDAILRFLPRSIPAMSAIERQTMEDKLGELKNRLQQLGENF